MILTNRQWILWICFLLALLSGTAVLAQEIAKPEYVIVVVPVMWRSSMGEFEQTAREELDHFISESQIERYADVRIEIITNPLTEVSLADPDLPDLVQRYALSLVSGDRYVGLTDGDLMMDGSSSIVGWTRFGSSAIVAEVGFSMVTAHELGHTFDLCDEYNYLYWSEQNKSLTLGCPNPYPDICPQTGNGVVCEGWPARDGSPSIMGPARGPSQRYNDPSLIQLQTVFEDTFGTPVGPTPTLPSGETPLPTVTPRPTATPTVPPLSQQIVVSAQVDGSVQLFIVETGDAGLSPMQLTAGVGPHIHADWSPDGQQLVYVSGQTGRLALYRMQLDSGQETLLVEDGLISHPAWSPTGDVIAFVTDRDGEMALYTVRPDGTNLQRLTPLGISVDWPAWSPDGKRLAYASDHSGDWEIYHQGYTAENGTLGTDIVKLTSSPDRDVSPVWAPDGKHIAFVSERDELLQIYVMPITADEVVRATLNQFNDWGPTWLDDTTILFHTFRGKRMNLYQVNWRQGNEVPVEINLVDVAWPVTRRR
ncbi:MAG: PD40 domain-containing protein [Anaerolineales bacterium]|nr:PD40 domain-containing protein [Anaerolineales bacterium]